jgi:hypothetical protein
MKTKKLLQIFTLFVIILFISFQNLVGQTSKLDSLIYGKNLSFVDGIIPAYYSSSCEKRAIETQTLLQKVVEMYSKNGQNSFKLKLAVIDSSEWTGFYYPYGFFFCDQGWIVIPGDLNYQKFASLFGFYPFSETLIKNLMLESNDPEELITNSLYKLISIHEVGHYYLTDILNASPPDNWSSEWMATYFATDFLYQNDKISLEIYNIYSHTYSKEFEPKYRSLTDFNTIFTGVGLQNYCWYHSMFQSMIMDIYSAFKSDFITTFANEFPETNKSNKSSQELFKIMDNITGGKTSKWVKILEGTYQ